MSPKSAKQVWPIYGNVDTANTCPAHETKDPPGRRKKNQEKSRDVMSGKQYDSWMLVLSCTECHHHKLCMNKIMLLWVNSPQLKTTTGLGMWAIQFCMDWKQTFTDFFHCFPIMRTAEKFIMAQSMRHEKSQVSPFEKCCPSVLWSRQVFQDQSWSWLFLVLVLILVLSYVQSLWDFHFCAWPWSWHLWSRPKHSCLRYSLQKLRYTME